VCRNIKTYGINNIYSVVTDDATLDRRFGRAHDLGIDLRWNLSADDNLETFLE